MNTLILLDGGHATLLKEITPSEVEHAVSDARDEGQNFVYIQTPNHGDNGYAVDPRKVVGVMRGGRAG